MFCPVCKAEYRLGFTHCSDCDVDLVEHLDDKSSAPGFTGDPDALEVLWAGTSAPTLSSITGALEAAKINFTSDSVESSFMPAFRESIFRIYVRKGDLAAASSALQSVDGGNPVTIETPGDVLDRNSSFLETLGINRNLMGRALEQAAPATDSEADDDSDPEPDPEDEIPEAAPSPGPAPDDLADDIDPEDATAEVWSGDDAQSAQFIKLCLSENGIACVIPQEESKQRILVRPAAESRAKEIIREIVENTPPA
jgi:hypothetical protein